MDYGGYSLDRIRAHQRPIWPEGVKEQINQFQIDFEPSINNEHIFEEQNEFKLTKEIKLEKTTVDETIFNEYLKNEWTENNEKNKGDKKKQNRTKQQNNIKMTKEKCKKIFLIYFLIFESSLDCFGFVLVYFLTDSIFYFRTPFIFLNYNFLF